MKSTLSAGAAAANVSFALSRGLSTDEIEKATGVSCFELLKPEARSPEDMMPNILALLAEKFPDQPFALEMARATPFSYFGGLADGAQFADDLRAAIGIFVKNSVIIADQLEISFSENSSGAWLTSRHPMDHIDDGRSHEVGMGLVARLFSNFLGVSDCLERVTFKHKPNCDVSHYTEYFGVPVEFNAPEMALYFMPEKLSAKIKYANVNLFNYVVTHLSVIKKQINVSNEPRELSLLKRVAQENALGGVFSASSVAAAANMSLRTAQRVTASQGTSIQELIENVRELRAKELLGDECNDMGAIALLLGYSDERAFRRAFERWTGQSPSEYRNTNKYR